MNRKLGQSRFHVGDHVRSTFGSPKMTGVIVEDLGPLGGQGRHLFRVEIPEDPFEPRSVHLREDEMEAVPPGTETPKSIDKQQVVDYLVNGGLISILWANRMGGTHQPRAWLLLDQLGNVTHTFYPERGILGGQIPPSGAVYNGKVFTDNRDAVLSFLESFGLNHQEAEEVVSEVGTAP
jgi:hypothetical protein